MSVFTIHYSHMNTAELIHKNLKSNLPIIINFDNRYNNTEMRSLESTGDKDPYALMELGYRFYLGKNGVSKNNVRAQECFQKVLLYQKNAVAMYYLGLISMQDKTRYKECTLYLDASMKLGNPDAAYVLGSLYLLRPDVVPKDYKKAYSYLKFAKDNGETKADGRLGRAAFHLGRYDLAKQYYETALRNGEKKYAVDLGDMYYSGLGVPKDLKKARHCYEIGCKAGAFGHPTVMLSKILMSGTTDEQYHAYKLLLEAVSHDTKEANYMVGRILLRGISGKVNKDPSAALQYFLREESKTGKAYFYAAKCYIEMNNIQDAAKYIRKALQRGYHEKDDYIISNPVLLLQYSIISENPIVSEYNDKYDKASINEVVAASDKDPAAMYELASRYRLGEDGVTKDSDKSFYYYKKILLFERNAGAYYWISHELDHLKLIDLRFDYLKVAYKYGSANAGTSLGIEYEFGTSKGFTKNYDKARECYIFARDHGNIYADCCLGRLYVKMGKEELAEKHYRIAIKNNIDDAMYELGKLLLQKNEKEEGLSLIKKAAELGYDLAKEFLYQQKEQEIPAEEYFITLYDDIMAHLEDTPDALQKAASTISKGRQLYPNSLGILVRYANIANLDNYFCLRFRNNKEEAYKGFLENHKLIQIIKAHQEYVPDRQAIGVESFCCTYLADMAIEKEQMSFARELLRCVDRKAEPYGSVIWIRYWMRTSLGNYSDSIDAALESEINILRKLLEENNNWHTTGERGAGYLAVYYVCRFPEYKRTYDPVLAEEYRKKAKQMIPELEI